VHVRASADWPSVAQLVSPSPRTRVGVVLLGAGAGPLPGRCDVVWRADSSDALSALAAALPGLAAAAGGAP
jgi:hypothetical protein